MKKFSFKSFVVGFLSCVLLTGSLSYAAQYKPIKVAVDAVKKIVINGADKTSSTFTPFQYEGTAYVPLGYIAEALDMKVKWDPKTGTVYINDSGNSREDTYLNAHGYEDLKGAGRLVVKDLDGKKVFYFEGVEPYTYKDKIAPSTISYKLNEKDAYKHLIGKFTFFEGGKDTSDIDAQVTIYGDDAVLYQSPFIRGNMEPVNLNVDISTVKNLKIEINAKSYKDGAKANIGFTDLRLAKE